MCKGDLPQSGVWNAPRRCLNRAGFCVDDAQGGKIMKNWKESPCTGCSRVDNWEKCDNKNCKLWQRWFLDRWEQLRKAMGTERVQQ